MASIVSAGALREVLPPPCISEALEVAPARLAQPGALNKQGPFPFVGEWDEEGVFFYQAFNATIADWAVKHQRFGGPGFSPSRMTWIKPSFAWMLYRAGYGGKDANQERILKVKLPHDVVAEILGRCFEGHGTGRREGHIQWDPARSLLRSEHTEKKGHGLEPAKEDGQRAIQIGMKNDLSKYYVTGTTSITDVT